MHRDPSVQREIDMCGARFSHTSHSPQRNRRITQPYRQSGTYVDTQSSQRPSSLSSPPDCRTSRRVQIQYYCKSRPSGFTTATFIIRPSCCCFFTFAPDQHISRRHFVRIKHVYRVYVHLFRSQLCADRCPAFVCAVTPRSDYTHATASPSLSFTRPSAGTSCSFLYTIYIE
jgi:hypothetical protein